MTSMRIVTLFFCVVVPALSWCQNDVVVDVALPLGWPPILLQPIDGDNNIGILHAARPSFRVDKHRQALKVVAERTSQLVPRISPWWDFDELPLLTPFDVSTGVGVPIGWCLGFEDFAHMTISIDTDCNRLTIRQGSHPPEVFRHAIPIKLIGDESMVTAKINGEQVVFVIDFTYTGLRLPREHIARLENGTSISSESAKYIDRLGIVRTNSIRHFPVLEFEGAPVQFVDVAEAEDSHGRISLDFLQRFKIVLDYDRLMLYLSDRANPERAGSAPVFGLLGAFSEDGVVIESVDKFDILTDVLIKDDIITAISGLSVVGRPRSDVVKALFKCWEHGGSLSIIRSAKLCEFTVTGNSENLIRREHILYQR